MDNTTNTTPVTLESIAQKKAMLLQEIRLQKEMCIRDSSKAMAIVLLPEPLKPVNQTITLCCFNKSSLSFRISILSNIGYMLSLIHIS